MPHHAWCIPDLPRHCLVLTELSPDNTVGAFQDIRRLAGLSGVPSKHSWSTLPAATRGCAGLEPGRSRFDCTDMCSDEVRLLQGRDRQTEEVINILGAVRWLRSFVCRFPFSVLTMTWSLDKAVSNLGHVVAKTSSCEAQVSDHIMEI